MPFTKGHKINVGKQNVKKALLPTKTKKDFIMSLRDWGVDNFLDKLNSINDPVKQLDLWLKAAEYIMPKMGRIDGGQQNDGRNTIVVQLQARVEEQKRLMSSGVEGVKKQGEATKGGREATIDNSEKTELQKIIEAQANQKGLDANNKTIIGNDDNTVIDV